MKLSDGDFPAQLFHGSVNELMEVVQLVVVEIHVRMALVQMALIITEMETQIVMMILVPDHFRDVPDEHDHQ